MDMPSEVIIVGGSLSGLICGIVLKHAGHHVSIIEKEADQRESHMAGLGLGLDAQIFVRRHDRLETPFSIESSGVREIDCSDGTSLRIPDRMALTSWDMLYYRLRTLFDGFTSNVSPTAPPSVSSDGTTRFQCRTQLVDVRWNPESKKMVVTVQDLETNKVCEKTADYVIGADGSNSALRQKYLPASRQKYAGYIGIRGTVPESELTPATKTAFEHNITIMKMDRQHCVIYMVPGPDGSIEPGQRLVNFLWYRNQTGNDLDEIMIDRMSGQRRHNTVPAGHIREDVWTGFISIAESTPFPSPALELIKKIRRPFIQAISDRCASKAAFEDGRVLLVGNAVALFRPNSAFSTSQAAFHAFQTECLLRGEIGLDRWEERVLRFSWIHWCQSRCWGMSYQNTALEALPALLNYWFACAIDRIKAWWYGEEPLLRGESTDIESRSKQD